MTPTATCPGHVEGKKSICFPHQGGTKGSKPQFTQLALNSPLRVDTHQTSTGQCAELHTLSNDFDFETDSCKILYTGLNLQSSCESLMIWG